MAVGLVCLLPPLSFVGARVTSARLSRGKLLKRVFEIDMAHCPNCGGELKIIAAIMDQPVI